MVTLVLPLPTTSRLAALPMTKSPSPKLHRNLLPLRFPRFLRLCRRALRWKKSRKKSRKAHLFPCGHPQLPLSQHLPHPRRPLHWLASCMAGLPPERQLLPPLPYLLVGNTSRKSRKTSQARHCPLARGPCRKSPMISPSAPHHHREPAAGDRGLLMTKYQKVPMAALHLAVSTCIISTKWFQSWERRRRCQPPWA